MNKLMTPKERRLAFFSDLEKMAGFPSGCLTIRTSDRLVVALRRVAVTVLYENGAPMNVLGDVFDIDRSTVREDVRTIQYALGRKPKPLATVEWYTKANELYGVHYA